MAVLAALLLFGTGALRAQQALPDHVVEKFGKPPAVPEGALSQSLKSAVKVAFIDSMKNSSWGRDQKIALDEKFTLINEHWRPKIAARLNGQEVKLVKVAGAFPWHRHAEVDEMFLVWRGRITLEFRDGAVPLGPGEALVVPRGVEHRPVAEEEAEVLVFEPAGVKNTGDVDDPVFTAPQNVDI